MAWRVIVLWTAVALLGANAPSNSAAPVTATRAAAPYVVPTNVTVTTGAITATGTATPAPPTSMTVTTGPITASGNATPKPPTR